MAISKTFVTAGDAIFTVACPDGTHHTYRVQHVEANDRYPASYFVKLLTGPDNTSNYSYLGKLDEHTSQTRTTAKSCAAQDSFAVRLLNRVLARVWGDDHAAYERHGYKTHHCGRCGRCGRRLTVPASVESGIGPECARIMGVDQRGDEDAGPSYAQAQQARDEAMAAGAY